MSKEKSGNINSDEEYGSDAEIITSQLGDMDLNSSGSKSSPSPTVVRSTSQSGSVSSKENTPSRTSSRANNFINPISRKGSPQRTSSSQGSLGSAAFGSDDDIIEQDDRFIEQNRWAQQQLQENRSGTSLGYGPGIGLTSRSVFDQQRTIDMSGRSFQDLRDKSRSLSTLEEASEGERSEQSSANPSRVPSRNSFSSLVSPKVSDRKRVAPFPGESLTETSQDSGMEKETSESSGDRSPGRKNKRSLSSPQEGFMSLDAISNSDNKRRKVNYVKPVVPIPKSSVPDELQEQLYEVWDEEKEDYDNYKLLKARQIREARRELKKGKKKVEAAGAGSDSDSDSYDEEIDAEYRELINLFSSEFEAFVAVINTGLYDPDRVNAESFFELMSFWLSLYYNINTTLRHRQVLINYLIEIREAISGISVMASNQSGRDNRQLIYFLHFLDELLHETRKEQQDYMNNKPDQIRGGSKKRKTIKRTAFKKTSRKTAKRNVKSKPKRKAARKIKLTRKKKATTKKRKFIKTKRSLKTNKKIRTRKR